MQLPGKAFGPANACGQCARPTHLAFFAFFGCFFFVPKENTECVGCLGNLKKDIQSLSLCIMARHLPCHYATYFMPQKGCNLLNSKLLWFGRKNNQPTLQTQNKYHPPPKNVPSPLFHANYPPWKQQVRTWKWIHFFNTSFLFGALRPVFTGELVSFTDSRASPAAHPPVSIPRNTAAATSRRSPKLASNKGNAKPKDKVST